MGGQFSGNIQRSRYTANFENWDTYPEREWTDPNGKVYKGWVAYRATHSSLSWNQMYNTGTSTWDMGNVSSLYSSGEEFWNTVKIATDVQSLTFLTPKYPQLTNPTSGSIMASSFAGYYENDSQATNESEDLAYRVYLFCPDDAESGGTKYKVTNNLTNVNADSENPTEIAEGESFTLKYTAFSGYSLDSATSNIGTVTIAEDKLSFTVTGTATEDIAVTASATEIPVFYTYTVEASDYTADASNPEKLPKGQPWSLTFYATAGNRIMTAGVNGESNVKVEYFGSPITKVTLSKDTINNDIKVIMTIVPSTVTKYNVIDSLTNVTAATNNPTQVTKDAEFTLNYTVNDGYKLDQYSSNIGHFSIDGKNITVTGTATEDITVNITAVAEKVMHKVTATLFGVDADVANPTEVEDGTEFTLMYALKSGYQNIKATSNIGEVDIQSDHCIISGTATEDIIVNVTAEAIPNVYVVSKEDLQNVTADPGNATQFNKGSAWSLTYHADENYSILSATSNYINATIQYSDDRRTVTLSYDNTDRNIQVAITAMYSPRSFKVSITGKFTNATCNYVDGETISTDKPITITSSEGYEFKEQYTLTKTRLDKDPETGTFEKNVAKNTLTYDTTGNTWNLVLDDEYTATLPSTSVSTFTNLYKVDNDILEQVSRVRFEENNIKYGETIDTVEKKIIDYGQFVTSLYVIPFAVPESLSTQQSNIILGIKDTDIKAPLISDYKYVVDLGSVTVDRQYQNVYDFLNTSCQVQVPYFDSFSLANEYVIGQTLTFKVTVDLYSGNGTLDVVSSFTNGNVYTTTKKISLSIPFVQDQTNTVVNTLSSIFHNTTDKVVVTVTRNNPYGDVSVFGRATKELDTIGNRSGYIEVSDVELQGNATSDEKDTIKDLLKKGVFQNVPKVSTTKARKRSRKVTV